MTWKSVAALISSGIDIRIRKADLPDAEVIADFNLRLATETEGLALDPGCISAGVIALLRDPRKGVYYLAEADAQVAGQVMITYEWSDWRNGNLWWLQSVYVRKDFRGKGVFRALFEHVHRLAEQEAGVEAIRLYMHADNQSARRSYEALGMRQTKYVVFELALRQECVSG